MSIQLDTLADVAREIRQNEKSDTRYRLAGSAKQPRIEKIDAVAKDVWQRMQVENYVTMAIWARQAMANHTVADLNFNEREQLEDVVNVAFTSIREFMKKNPRQAPKAMEIAQRNTIAAKLGGGVHPKSCDRKSGDEQVQSFMKFLNDANLVHPLQRNRLVAPKSDIPMLPIAPTNHMDPAVWVLWEHIKRQEIPEGDPRRDEYGYRYEYVYQPPRGVDPLFPIGEVLFSTNQKGRLYDNTDKVLNYITWQGIKRHSPIEDDLIPSDFDKPEFWGNKHVVEFNSFTSEEGAIVIGDEKAHSWLTLRMADGRVYSIGLFGALTFNKHLGDHITLFGMRGGKTVSADWYHHYARDKFCFNAKRVEITKEKAENLLAVIQEAHNKNKGQNEADRIPMSLMKHNCCGFVVNSIEKATGIKVDAKISITRFLLRGLLPDRVMKVWDRMVAGFNSITACLPVGMQTFLKKASYFIPPIYVLNLIIGLLARFISLNDHSGFAHLKQITIWDVIFRPWKVYMYHPVVMNETIDKLAAQAREAGKVDQLGQLDGEYLIELQKKQS